MDLGIVVPAAAVIGIGLLRRAPWTHRGTCAMLGGYTLLSTAVAGMAIVMYVNDGPDGSLANVILFTAFSAALAWLTTALYGPLVGHRASGGRSTRGRDRRVPAGFGTRR